MEGGSTSALDYAHEQGVVHRDIKPENILLSGQGEPLVADFGIALAVAQAGGGRITETGLSLGTPHYMSPEQATGDRDVDPRSDVFALGCVLYEMLAAQTPFAASTAQAILVRILTESPRPITQVRGSVPPHVDSVLAKALEKLPADRFENVAEFASALEDEGFRYQVRPRAAPTPATPEVLLPEASARPWLQDRRTIAGLVAGTALAAVAAWGWFQPPPEPGVPTRAMVSGVENMTGGSGWRLAISPDGRSILKVVGGAIHIRPAGDPEWRQLRNTEGGPTRPFRQTGDRWRSRSGAGSGRYPLTVGQPFR